MARIQCGGRERGDTLTTPDTSPTANQESPWGAVPETAIRPALPADGREVARVLLEAYEAAWGPSGWEDYRVEVGDTASRMRDSIVLVAESGALVVGTVTIVPPTSRLASGLGPCTAEVRMLAVVPSRQGRGTGEALMRAGAGLAQRLGLEEMALHCDDDLRPAHRLYGRLGFLRDPASDRWVGPDMMARAYRRMLPLPPPPSYP
ncbi:MAG TPA: GNAT family N-acetyltransferase [Acidimicrobiales bacterium]|nr:GNAT family N-acetyltransferase [Acidimicrobiales bacterium]